MTDKAESRSTPFSAKATEESTARTEANASNPPIVFFGMEITLTEAIDLLSQASIICSLVPGASSQNANWGMVLKMAAEFQRQLVEMHSAPGRVLIRCAACGGSVGDNPATPYLRVSNPLPVVSPVVEQVPTP